MWVPRLLPRFAPAPRFWFLPEVFIMVDASGGWMSATRLLFASLAQSAEEVVEP